MLHVKEELLLVTTLSYSPLIGRGYKRVAPATFTVFFGGNFFVEGVQKIVSVKIPFEDNFYITILCIMHFFSE